MHAVLKKKKRELCQRCLLLIVGAIFIEFSLHHNLTSYYLTSRYRVQALYNSSKQGNVTVALYISGVLIKLTPNFSWEAECFFGAAGVHVRQRT